MQVSQYTISASFPFKLIFNKGSVTSFQHSKGAIVNAANKACLGGGGVDGAISAAGGELLFRHRLALPIIEVENDDDADKNDFVAVRCPVGEAKLTGPGNYDALRVPYVIHAVGPSYWDFERNEYNKADELLKSSYRESLIRAKEVKLEAIAFSLISAGVYRGERSLKSVLKFAVETICEFEGYEELREIHMFAFNKVEMRTLQRIMEEFDS